MTKVNGAVNASASSVSSQCRTVSNAPYSFKQYVKLCFTPRRDRLGPTPASQWITMTNTYLLWTVAKPGRTQRFPVQDNENYQKIPSTHDPIDSTSFLLCQFFFGLASAILQMPGVPWLPALNIVINLHLMFKMSGITWIYYAIWMLLGKCNCQILLLKIIKMPYFYFFFLIWLDIRATRHLTNRRP
ncbi:hypothetical protein FBUS_00158 [Fasciolopsis buskii]|uniref:Cationic amino acid transporter C-terminal domain-containing protein n=1 Tax=Fasciolopsis buskii TaxID=27845 RepID=A0A8E0VKL6_9TREM|nr:hypothetical protein FBUS_00158 [Fasciolopsis buski]